MIFAEGEPILLFGVDAFEGSEEEGAGIGLAEEGIGLSTPRPAPVDVVLNSGWSYRPRNVIDFSQWRVAKKEKSELREMMELYALWKKAA